MSGLMRIPETLVDFQLFLDGYGAMGEVPSVTLPAITEIFESVDLPGAATAQKQFMGMFEEMECEFTLLGLNPYTLGLFGEDDKLFTFRAASSQRDRPIPVLPIVAYMTGRLYALETEEIQKKAMTRSRCRIDVRHYKLVHSGVVMCEIAADGSVVKFGGRDMRSLINAAIGNPAGIINGILGG